ncbi:hypothetical protein KIW84_030727 [Lathyrus oleraceus]|uniref:Uncharacterized protein n=1 Tax=Pisum sativum TaxID=3888 RepID=A0A9D4XT55_PEA|nr:hypothetical protein KIW84_030727 [Pisum sativum]
MKVKPVNLTEQSYAGRNTESIEEGVVGIMQATPVTTREKELHLQVTQLQQSTGSLVDELRRQKMKYVRLERQIPNLTNLQQKEMKVKPVNLTEQSYAGRNTKSIEEGAVGIMQATPVITREKELHLQVTQLSQSTGSLVDELRRQKMKNVQLERQLSSVNNKIEK